MSLGDVFEWRSDDGALSEFKAKHCSNPSTWAQLLDYGEVCRAQNQVTSCALVACSKLFGLSTSLICDIWQAAGLIE